MVRRTHFLREAIPNGPSSLGTQAPLFSLARSWPSPSGRSIGSSTGGTPRGTPPAPPGTGNSKHLVLDEHHRPSSAAAPWPRRAFSRCRSPSPAEPPLSISRPAQPRNGSFLAKLGHLCSQRAARASPVVARSPSRAEKQHAGVINDCCRVLLPRCYGSTSSLFALFPRACEEPSLTTCCIHRWHSARRTSPHTQHAAQHLSSGRARGLLGTGLVGTGPAAGGELLELIPQPVPHGSPPVPAALPSQPGAAGARGRGAAGVRAPSLARGGASCPG